MVEINMKISMQLFSSNMKSLLENITLATTSIKTEFGFIASKNLFPIFCYPSFVLLIEEQNPAVSRRHLMVSYSLLTHVRWPSPYTFQQRSCLDQWPISFESTPHDIEFAVFLILEDRAYLHQSHVFTM